MISNFLIVYGNKKDEVNMSYIRLYVVCFTFMVLILLIFFGMLKSYEH